MLQQVASIFVQTYSVQGPDANEQIKIAEQMLDQFGGSPDFCCCLFQIIVSKEMSTSIRQSACIYLTNMILYHYDDIPPQSKELIVKNIPELLLNSNLDIFGILMKLTSAIVSKAFPQNQWPDLLTIISNNFQTAGNGVLVALMLSKNVSSLFKTLTDMVIPLYSTFCESIIPILTRIISENRPLLEISLCFKIIRLLSISSYPQIFATHPDIMNHWFNYVASIEDKSELPHFDLLACSVISFCTTYFYKYPEILDPILSVSVLNAIVSISLMNINTKLQGKCVLFFKYAIFYPPTWNSIIADIDNFTQIVLFPYFQLSENDLLDFENDPQQFILNFHSFSYDESDPRAYLLEILRFQAECSVELRESFTRLFKASISYGDPLVIFSYSLMFSSVAPFVNPQDILNDIIPLLQNPTIIIQCAALISLRYLKVPLEIIYQTFVLLQSPSILIQYYSAINLTKYLPKLTTEESQKLREICSQNIINILQIYFKLSEEFNDYSFIELIQIYIKFFGPELFNHAIGFIQETYQLFLKCVSLNNQISANIILSSLSIFIQMLALQPEICDIVCNFLFKQILSDIPKVPLPIIESLIDLISSIISSVSIITSIHWEIFHIFQPLQTYFPYEICISYRNLIIRDQATAKTPEIAKELINVSMQMLNTIGTFQITPIISLLTTIFVVLKDISGAEQLFNMLLPIVIDLFNSPGTMYYASNLFAAMILYNAEYLFQILQNNKNSIIEIWLNHCHFQELMAVITNKYQMFSLNELIVMSIKAIQLLNEEVKNIIIEQMDQNLLKFEDAPDQVQIKSLQLFQEKSLINDLFNLINKINQENQGFQQSIQNSFNEPLLEIYNRAISYF